MLEIGQEEKCTKREWLCTPMGLVIKVSFITTRNMKKVFFSILHRVRRKTFLSLLLCPLLLHFLCPLLAQQALPRPIVPSPPSPPVRMFMQGNSMKTGNIEWEKKKIKTKASYDGKYRYGERSGSGKNIFPDGLTIFHGE